MISKLYQLGNILVNPDYIERIEGATLPEITTEGLYTVYLASGFSIMVTGAQLAELHKEHAYRSALEMVARGR